MCIRFIDLIKSLFTSIPRRLVINNIIMRWDTIRSNTNICLDLFLEIVDFCMSSSYCKFNGQHYLQVSGTAMGNPVSPALADLVMESLLDTVLQKLDFPLPFIRKYVDDLIMAIPLNKLQHIMDIFNSYDIHIQFTYELEVENCLPFLDMLLTRHDNQKVTTRWYQKPIASGRFLNFHSFHPMNQKLNTAKNFIKRVNKLSTDLDEHDKIKIIDDQLKQNGFPKSLRNRLTNRMNEHSMNEQHRSSPSSDESDLEYTYRSIAYMPRLLESIDREIKRSYKNIRLATYNWRTVGDLFTKLKDPISGENQTDVIYNIPCSNCSACYIGMTINRLKTRMSGHKTHYNTLDRLLDNGVNPNDPQIASLKEKNSSSGPQHH
ncbi:uncharacterized protein LOC134285401 [Aedes albopictus]|uniref:Helix-turn-helix domain-containing protein n=1 Tax=Aedes albopictus TaxID=7160 RepID=A0ABM1Y860_AEDAL